MASKRALLVAINDYGSPQNNLPSCLEDAKRFRSLMEKRYGFKSFEELYDHEATPENVDAGLSWLFKDAGHDDRLVFYFSGHGFQLAKGQKLEECLVLSGIKFFFDDRLSEFSQSVPPAVLTVVLDSCFSGGMEKRVAFDGEIEVARTKRWEPPPDASETLERIGKSYTLQPFGSEPVTDPTMVKQMVLGRTAGTADGKGFDPTETAADAGDEAGQLRLNGLLLSACSENETASASTSKTEGMSAFTYALVQALAAPGDVTASELRARAATRLKGMGFRQTPLLKAPPKPAGLATRGFVTMASVSAPVRKPAKDTVLVNGGMEDRSDIAAQPGEEHPMDGTQQIAPQIDEKFLGGIVAAVASAVAPVVAREGSRLVQRAAASLARRKDFDPGLGAGSSGGAGGLDEKFLANLVQTTMTQCFPRPSNPIARPRPRPLSSTVASTLSH